MNTDKTDQKALHLIMPKELVDRVDEYRYKMRLRSRVIAISDLLNTALVLAKARKGKA